MNTIQRRTSAHVAGKGKFQVSRCQHAGGVGQGVSKSRPYIGRKMKRVSEAASYMDGKRNSYRSHALNEHEKEKVSQATP